MNATATITVGALIRKRVRQELEKLKFQGMEFEWMESKHFLDSDFYLKDK